MTNEFCSECGAKITSNTGFCSKCGAPNNLEKINKNISDKKNKNKRKNKNKITLVFVIAILFLIIALSFFGLAIIPSIALFIYGYYLYKGN